MDLFDYLAELTRHIPDKGEHLVRFFGWYLRRRRGMRAKQAAPEEIGIDRSLPGTTALRAELVATET